MSLSVRLWTSQDLQKVFDGDRWLLTLLANAKTFNRDMMRVHSRMIHLKLVKEYEITYTDSRGSDETLSVNASDDEMLLKFVAEEYTLELKYIAEVTRQYRYLEIPQTQSE